MKIKKAYEAIFTESESVVIMKLLGKMSIHDWEEFKMNEFDIAILSGIYEDLSNSEIGDVNV